MSIHCSERVWEHSNQKGAALLLLLAIAEYAGACSRKTKTGATGFAWPGLQTLADKTRLSSRHVSRLIAGLQSAGELLVLPRPGPGLPHPGRRHLYIVLAGANGEVLVAALQKAASRGAVPVGTESENLIPSRLLQVTTGHPVAASHPMVGTPDGASPNTSDVSSPTHDNLSPTPDKLSSPPDNLSGTQDIAVSSDPSLSGIDPSVNKRWQTALNGLRSSMVPATFDHCLRGSRVIQIEDNVWTVQIIRPLALDWIEHRLAGRIRQILDYYLPGIQVRFVPRGSAQTGRAPGSAQNVRSTPPQPAPAPAPRTTQPDSGRPTPVGPIPPFPRPLSVLHSPFLPPSHLCFQIMFTSLATGSVVFNLF